LKGRSVTTASIDSWILSIKRLADQIEGEFLKRQAEMLDPLHDPMRLAKQISTISNRLIIQRNNGSSYEEKLLSAPAELKTLVKAADLLSDSFELLAIYFNPAAAAFGRKSAINIHGLLTKIISIFRINDDGITASHTNIYLNGSCYRNIFAHESFKLIPFALLSNAAKYGTTGKTTVHIMERKNILEISVESTGPYIEENERTKIFEKSARGKWAKQYTTDGRGVGLYLANIIAKAHDTEIKVSSLKTGRTKKGIPEAVNRFSIEISTLS
jgi:hypothetical protein